MEYTINIGLVYKCPLDNPMLGVKEKVELARVTWESSDDMKILKVSKAFIFPWIVL